MGLRFMVLCLGAPGGSTSSGSGLKSLRRWGQTLRVSSNRLGESGIKQETPGYKVGGLSTTPRWLLRLQLSFKLKLKGHTHFIGKNCWKKYFKRSCRVKAFSPAKTAMIVMPGKSITNLLKVCLFKIFLLPGVSRQHDNKLN